jgi:hypothetical protein
MIPVKPKPESIFAADKFILSKIGFLPINICDEIIQYGKEFKTKGNYGPWKGRFEGCGLPLDHNIHSFFNELWEESINFFNCSIDFIECYQLKYYKFGYYFGKHTDHIPNLENKIDRKLTMSVQLSSEHSYTGGELVVIGNTLPKTVGSVFIFPSIFKHEIKQVGFGERWSLITWAWGEAYK